MSSIDNRTAVSVVVQTHWDREWYLPHQSFIARLLQVMEQVAGQLASGQLRHFLFDGQTAAMEDLLAHCEPALAERVLELAAQGRIVLGPWYVMADQFLCSGEALLRNLETGIGDANRYGNCQRVGYLPDTFGHVGQMPQLLHNFGIDSAVMWRGVDHPHAEFDWRAPDGSTVGALFLTQGYYQHPLNVPLWSAALESYLEQVAPRSLAPRLLLTQGGDHLVARAGLDGRIADFNASQERYLLVQETLAEHVAAALAGSAGRRTAIDGELRANAQAFVLPDVLSTRRYLKRLNQQAEDRLLGAIEPLHAQLDLSPPQAYLDQTWRLLLQQHAHDSICGCSVDAVHDEMRTRYVLLEQRLDALTERAQAQTGMIALSTADGDAFADDSRFTLFNPLPQLLDGWHEASLFLAGPALPALALAGPDGAPLEHVLLAVAPCEILRSPLDDFPDMLKGHRYTLAIRCALPGMAALACTAAAAGLPVQDHELAGDAVENAHLRIAFQDGALHWTDLGTGASHQDPLLFMSELDAGDSYNFSPPPEQLVTVLDRFRLNGVRRLPGMQEMTLALDMVLPAGLDADRQGAAAERVACSGLLRLRLWEGQAALDCHLEWNNAACDQRTRLLLPLPDSVACTWSDSAFEWKRRPLRLAQIPAAQSRREMPVCVEPSHSVVCAGTLAVAHRAMQEYEVVQLRGRRYLGLTLVRSVGWLSRRDLVTRGVGAGPDLATPGAQCLGSEPFEFSIGRVEEGNAAQALGLARRLRRPALLLRGHAQCWRTPFSLGDARLQVSSLRRLDGEIELRAWNPCDEPLDTGLHGWRRVRADGQPQDASTLVAPHAIATFRRLA